MGKGRGGRTLVSKGVTCYIYIVEIVEIVMNNTIGALGLQRYHLHVHHSHKRSVKIVINDTAISSLVLSTTFLLVLLTMQIKNYFRFPVAKDPDPDCV